MLNMGGPSSLDGAVDGVEPFLRRLFLDGEIIMLGPLQKFLVRARGAPVIGGGPHRGVSRRIACAAAAAVRRPPAAPLPSLRLVDQSCAAKPHLAVAVAGSVHCAQARAAH